MKRAFLLLLALGSSAFAATDPWWGTGTVDYGGNTYTVTLSGFTASITGSGGASFKRSDYNWWNGSAPYAYGVDWYQSVSGSQRIQTIGTSSLYINGIIYVSGSFSRSATPPAPEYTVTINVTTTNRYGTDYYKDLYPDFADAPIVWGAIWSGELLYSYFDSIPASNEPVTVSKTYDFEEVAGETIEIHFTNADNESYGSVDVPGTTETDLVYDLALDPLPAPLEVPEPTPAPTPAPEVLTPPTFSPTPAPDFVPSGTSTSSDPFVLQPSVVSQDDPDIADGYTDPIFTPFASGTAPGGNPETADMTKDDFYDAVRRGVEDSGSVGVPDGDPDGVEYGELEGSGAEGNGGLGESIGGFLAASDGLAAASSNLLQSFAVEFPSSFGDNQVFEIPFGGQSFEVNFQNAPFREWIRGLAYLTLLTSGFFAARAIIRGAFVDQS